MSDGSGWIWHPVTAAWPEVLDLRIELMTLDTLVTLVLELAAPDVRVLFEQVVCSHVSGVWSVTHQNFLVSL